MKNFISLIVLVGSLLSISHAHAAILGAPFLPEIDARFNCLESGYCSQFIPGGQVFANSAGSSTYPVALGGELGNSKTFTKYTAKGILNLTGDVAGTYNFPMSIPPSAIITQAYFELGAAITPSGTTIAVTCLTSGDILAAVDKTGSSINTIFAGIEVGTAATMLYTATNGCVPTVTTAVHTATAGIVDLFLDYVIAN